MATVKEIDRLESTQIGAAETRRRRPGPVPGTKHAGQFSKGHDPRRHVPTKRSTLKQSIESMCQVHAPDAVKFLADLVNDEDAHPKERAKAAAELLDRSFGTPVNRIMTATVNDSSKTGAVGRLLELLDSDQIDTDFKEIEAEFTEITPNDPESA